jgi:heat-inducible transcriptional repressor
LELNDRKRQILKAVVDSYIEKCEPVGSKYLADSYKLDLSPATIRNTMSELEALGLLEQPYTSAGRIPSSLGYRVYVDSLMQSYRLTSREIREINEINENLNIKITRLDKIIEQAGKLMSALTSLMAISMTPKSMSVSIVKIDLVFFDPNNFLLVILTSVNIVKTKHIYSRTNISEDVLDHLKKVLNSNLAETDINSVTLPLILSMETMMGNYSGIISPVLKVLYEAIKEINEAEIYIDGAANLFNMPEYHDIEKAKSLINLIDNKDRLLNIFSESASDNEERLNIYIGEENQITSGGDSSFIFKTFSLGDKILGAIGVIGPKRMDYSKIIAKLEYFSGNMADIIKQEIDEKYTAIDDSKFMQGGKSGNE